MDRMIGREREMELLNSSFGESSAFLIFGRRRIGKTFLLEHFCEGKRNLFFTCVQEDDNLQYFADVVSDFTGVPRDAYGGYYEFFKDLGSICMGQPTVVVMDEFQFLAMRNREVLSYVQQFIDTRLSHTGSMLILCGSSVRFMRSLNDDGRNPLYGRFRRIIHLGPLTFEQCRQFHPGMSDIDCLRLYLTVGGIPRYHREIHQDTYEGCIKENFLSDGWMLDEADSLIMAEFSPSEQYIAVLAAISKGAVRLKDISGKVGVDESTCSGYLRELIKSGIVGVIHPMMGAPKRRVFYIADNLFAFHHEVIVRRRSMISNQYPDRSYSEIKQHIDTFLGRRFELFCEDFIRKNYIVTEMGKWWIDDPKRNVHEDIDIVARLLYSGNRIDLFVECKFTKSSVGFHEYNILERRVEDHMRDSNARLCMISVSGFDRDLEEFAEGARVLLIGPEELFGYSPVPEV